VNFEFATANRVVFGSGSLAGIGAIARGLGQARGRRAFVTTGSDSSRAAPLLALLAEAGFETMVESRAGEPTFDSVRGALGKAREFGTDLVVGFGGGSALDSAKALAALLANGGDPLDYAEIVGAGRPLALPSLPCIAIPTTAGTGTEVTKNAVLVEEGRSVKVSLRSPTMLPAVALVDPELTLGCPARVTADSGLDALTQLIEPYVSSRSNPLVDIFCLEGIARAFRALPLAYRDGADRGAREDMALASLYGGLALANAGLGAVHGLAGPLGGLTGAPHGALCGALLPAVVEANLRALARGAGGDAYLRKYDEIASLAGTGRDGLAAALGAIASGLGARRLGALGLRREDIGAVATAAAGASSMKANPVALRREELEGILEASW
jgi:alcohol dehydrogenase class IV